LLPVEVSVRHEGDLTILRLTGKILGGHESDELREEIERFLTRGGHRLLVDMTGVPWLNSAGLGILLSAYSRLRERGGVIRFSGAGERVRGILRTTKLLTVLDVHDDEESGIRSFRSADGLELAPRNLLLAFPGVAAIQPFQVRGHAGRQELGTR
jgi:anti-sigma B factor antagonist